MRLMYGRRKNNLKNDAQKMAHATTQVIKTFVDLKGSWDKVKGKVWENRQARQSEDYQHESFFGTTMKGLPGSDLWGLINNPQGSNTGLCINRLLDPYECCTDDATAYECCFGLVGCLPPPPQINITAVDNIDFIINASCSSGSDIILSIFALPRFVFGTYVWILVFISPTWVRPILFKILYPLLYDYGGRGIYANFLGDLFCLIVNLYYLILIVIIILGLYIVDFVYIAFLREILLMIDVGRMDREVSKLKESTDLDRKTSRIEINKLSKMVAELNGK